MKNSRHIPKREVIKNYIQILPSEKILKHVQVQFISEWQRNVNRRVLCNKLLPV
jgi:hypothetical protein